MISFNTLHVVVHNYKLFACAVISSVLVSAMMQNVPDNKVHGAKMGPTRVLYVNAAFNREISWYPIGHFKWHVV